MFPLQSVMISILFVKPSLSFNYPRTEAGLLQLLFRAGSPSETLESVSFNIHRDGFVDIQNLSH